MLFCFIFQFTFWVFDQYWRMFFLVNSNSKRTGSFYLKNIISYCDISIIKEKVHMIQ